jgi:peptidoglycan-associated lipoprotein
MGSRLRLVTLTVALVSTLSGCAGSSWQFWKSSASTETPAEPVAATAAPTPPTAMPVSPASDLVSHGFVPRPELVDVRFRSGYVTVNKADAPVLDNALRWLKEHPDTVVRIEGHSDDLGTPASNMAAGEKRAVSVMKYLVAKGLEPERVSIVSYGSDRPLCSEKTDACRAKNRRTQFLVKRR